MAGKLGVGLIALVLSGCGGTQDSASNGTGGDPAVAADAAGNAAAAGDDLANYGTDVSENKADAIEASDPANLGDPAKDSPEDPPGAR